MELWGELLKITEITLIYHKTSAFDNRNSEKEKLA